MIKKANKSMIRLSALFLCCILAFPAHTAWADGPDPAVSSETTVSEENAASLTETGDPSDVPESPDTDLPPADLSPTDLSSADPLSEEEPGNDPEAETPDPEDPEAAPEEGNDPPAVSGETAAEGDDPAAPEPDAEPEVPDAPAVPEPETVPEEPAVPGTETVPEEPANAPETEAGTQIADPEDAVDESADAETPAEPPAAEQETKPRTAVPPEETAASADDPSSPAEKETGTGTGAAASEKTAETEKEKTSGTPEEKEELAAALEEQDLEAANAGDEYCDSFDSGVAYLRAQMVARVSPITFYCTDGKMPNVYLKAAQSYSDSCTGQEGDALGKSYSGISYHRTPNAGSATYEHNGKYYYKYEFHTNNNEYYTTAGMENVLTNQLATEMSLLHLDDLSEAGKAVRIHDYICSSVSYEEGSAIGLYSAYGALISHTANSQGIGLLFYRMCKDAGLSVRCISGSTNLSANIYCWNLVRINGKWYNVDCSADIVDGSDTAWLLKSPADFPDHTRNANTDTEEFHANYPMSDASWLPGPTIYCTVDNVCGPVLSWSPANGAVQYYVNRKLSTESTYHVLSLVSGTNYVDTSAGKGKTYDYQITGIDEDYDMIGYSSVRMTASFQLPSVTITTDPSFGCPVIKYNSLNGASKLRIYRSDSVDGDYTLIQTITMNGSSGSYVDTDTEYNKWYYYKCCGVSSALNKAGPFTTITGVKTKLGKPELTVKLNSAKEPQLSWTGSPFAVRYYAYRALSGTGSYTLVKKLTKTTITDTKALAGKLYDYKIVAEAANGATVESAPVTIRVLYRDVPLSSSYSTAIYWATDEKIAAGYSDGSRLFGIADTITRGQFVMFLWKMAGWPEPAGTKQTFRDVPTSSNFYKPVQWAYENGITTGYTGSRKGLFGVRDNVTRGQIMMFLWRYADKPAPSGTPRTFSDVPSSHPYYTAIQWGSAKGITKGYSDGRFGLYDNCTRGQCIMFLYRMNH